VHSLDHRSTLPSRGGTRPSWEQCDEAPHPCIERKQDEQQILLTRLLSTVPKMSIDNVANLSALEQNIAACLTALDSFPPGQETATVSSTPADRVTLGVPANLCGQSEETTPDSSLSSVNEHRVPSRVSAKFQRAGLSSKTHCHVCVFRSFSNRNLNVFFFAERSLTSAVPRKVANALFRSHAG
jgi:hypothetical protein